MTKLLIVADTNPPSWEQLYYECLQYHVNRYKNLLDVEERNWNTSDRKARSMLRVLGDRILAGENLYALSTEFGYHMKMMIDLGYTSMLDEKRYYAETFKDLNGGVTYENAQ